jgi:hypothetical protein
VELDFCLEQHPFLLLTSCPPRVLYNPVFCVNRIFCNPAFRVSRILRNPAFRVRQIFCSPAFRVGRILRNPDFYVSNMTGTSFFILRVANPVNPDSLICPSIHAAVWANPSSLANPICLPVYVAILVNPVNLARVMLLRLANPVNPAVITRIFTFVCDLCSNTCHP